MQGYNNSATLAQQQMQGFVPNVQQPELDPVQQTSAETYRGSYESDMAELSQLEGLLRTVDSQIAELENSNPRDTERKLASLGASIGDMSLYNAMLAREGEQSRKVSGAPANINNILSSAWEVSGQLSRGQLTEAEADVLARKMMVAKQKAEEEADKLGYDLSTNQYYRDVSEALADYAPVPREELSIGGFSVKNDVDARNKIMDLFNKKALSDTHIESKARGASKKQKAWDLYSELSNLGNRELVQRVRSLSKEERKLLETYHPDILSLTR